MTHAIAFLHTARSNEVLFTDAIQNFVGKRRHLVREDLLARAVAAGGLTPAIREETGGVLRQLAQDAEIVLVTCSTLGPAADDLDEPRIRRVDRALAEAAVATGRSVIALCTVPSTLGPTRDLFEQVAAASGVSVDIELIDGAWGHFQRGATQDYFAAIAEAADRLAGEDVVIAFAQASMAPAAGLCRKASPLTSVTSALAAR